ncbi:MAG: hypothetical protein K9J12_06135 [Melioribacteraceae bacterium]|nr:hypothetical protein [Melioribacteraceae bacterium]MCF8264667.1 hypothetical protein [Melioribacteraceae bacterium]MCF8412842.1 hypothetical protein [Melioribacteraceae bacterium]
MTEKIEINSIDFWFKVTGMLQQNWALIESTPNQSVIVYFIHDASGLFDQMIFPTINEAIEGLKRNGFRRYVEDREFQEITLPPSKPYHIAKHPSGKIYSSGKYWV